jgi:hypothetical protein
MLEDIHSTVMLESILRSPARVFDNCPAVQRFRFLPESFLASVGTEWDSGFDQLVYLRMFVEEETGDAFSLSHKKTI